MTFSFIALLVATTAAFTLPKLSTVAQNGRQGNYRVINRLVTAGPNVVISGSGSLFNSNGFPAFYTSADVRSTVKAGSVTTSVQTHSFTDDLPAYITVDTGNNRVAQVNLTVVTTLPGNIEFQINCGSNSIEDGEFATFVVTQSLSSSSSSCQTVNSNCQNTLTSNGTVTLSCQKVTNSLADSRVCGIVPVRYYNFQTSCTNQVFVERRDLRSGSLRTFDTTRPLPSGVGTQVQESRSSVFAIADTTLPLGAENRFVDVFVTASGVVKSQNPLNTTFVNIANLAYTTSNTPSFVRNNTFRFVVSKTSTITDFKSIVHVSSDIDAGQASGWIEIPLNPTGNTDLTVFVFAGGNSESDVLGDVNPNPVTGATRVRLYQETFSVDSQANRMTIVRLFSANNDTGSLDLNTVPLNGEGINIGTTKFILWNNINATNFVVANTTSSSTSFECRLLPINGGTLGTNSGVLVATRNQTSPLELTVRDSSASCGNLGSPINPAISFSIAAPSSSVCKVLGSILQGRRTSFQTETPAVCSGGSSTFKQNDIVTSLSASPTDFNNPSNSLVQNFDVELCDCAIAVTPASCPAVTLCDLTSALSSQTTAILGPVSSGSSATNNGLAGIRTAITAAANAATADADDIIGAVDSVRSDIKKVRKEIKDISKDINDLD